MKSIGNTISVCPLCFQEGKINKIEAQLVEDESKIWMLKKCLVHGSFKELYFNDEKIYNRWIIHKVIGTPIPEIKTSLFNDSPLYAAHLSQPVLVNLVVTNRDNLRNPDCSLNVWNTGYVYEPSIGQLNDLMLQVKAGAPPGSYAIQITGGEPTLRNDLFDIIGNAKKFGYSHIQLQTNGIILAENLEYCHKLKDVGVDTVYMNFDGMEFVTNPLITFHKKALENLRNVNMKVVLVPILIGGKNVKESGKIVRFALEHIDVVRGVHFLPKTFYEKAMKMNTDDRQRQRVDFLQMISPIEEEFPGMISRYDFYPIPLMDPLLQLLEMTTREPQVRFTAHPCCGASTLMYIDEGKPLPIARFINAETILQFIHENKKKKGHMLRLRILYAFTKSLDSFIKEEKAPYGFDLRQIARETATIGPQYAMRNFNQKTLFIGMMWFQDVWNLDVDRLQQCVVHYITPEGIIPSCSYHGLGYDQKVQKKYSISIEDWEKKTGQLIVNDLVKDSK
jgi:uncharacterized radical SAM superfamily Fe-S cluster-containing enzyme